MADLHISRLPKWVVTFISDCDSTGVRELMSTAVLERARLEGWSDEDVVARVIEGDTALFELLMRRHNQRIYRVARAILRDDAEAEDVMQDTYVRAYQHLS